MNIFNNFKSFILTFILTIILGWYLGLAISSTIDNRLKNASIHMPKPKNNIVVKVLKKPKNINIDVKDNSKDIEDFLNYKTKLNNTSNKKRKKTDKKNIKENLLKNKNDDKAQLLDKGNLSKNKNNDKAQLLDKDKSQDKDKDKDNVQLLHVDKDTLKDKKSKDRKNNKDIKKKNNKDINLSEIDKKKSISLDKDLMIYRNNYEKNVKKNEKINKIKDIYIPANTEKLDSEMQRINSKMEYITDKYFIKGKKKMFIPANKYL